MTLNLSFKVHLVLIPSLTDGIHREQKYSRHTYAIFYNVLGAKWKKNLSGQFGLHGSYKKYNLLELIGDLDYHTRFITIILFPIILNIYVFTLSTYLQQVKI